MYYSNAFEEKHDDTVLTASTDISRVQVSSVQKLIAALGSKYRRKFHTSRQT